MTLPTTNYQLQTSQTGLSLTEVVISMGILIALFALYTAALNTTTVTQRMRYQNFAYHAASKQMEELRGTMFVALPSVGAISDPLLDQLPSGAGSFAVADYALFPGLKEITVTVTWTEGALGKQVVLKTLSGAGGINP